MPNTNQENVSGSPTKEFFYEMITRDISLLRAILDLVDNSVDGALRKKPDWNFKNLWIKIDINKDSLEITDNCGGIPLDVAKNYAFRFGRPKEVPITKDSIGLFGIGMKRAFFKLGSIFRVESYTREHDFVIEENLQNWLKKKDSNDKEIWDFPLEILEKRPPEVKRGFEGTKIKISGLHQPISEVFKLGEFENELGRELSLAHTLHINYNLEIFLKSIKLEAIPLELLLATNLKPACVLHKLNKKVKARIYAGVHKDRNLNEGGWYVFCNNRMLLDADQTIITGWGEGNGESIPKYHPNYAFFRGFIFFESKDPNSLPWTTTKSGVDHDSGVFKAAKLKMKEVARPIIDFLNSLEDERKSYEDNKIKNTPLKKAMGKANLIDIDALDKCAKFQSPKPAEKTKSERILTTISYKKPIKEVNIAKDLLRVKANWEVGEKTFEYWFEDEGKL